MQMDGRIKRKAQIFSIDAAIGAFVVGIIILAAIINFSKKVEVADIQTEKIGYDIVTILDYEGKLSSLNSTEIQRRMNETLPQQYDMRLRLEGDNFAAIEVGDVVTQRFTASGKRVFVNASSDAYGVATFWVWLH